MPNYFGLATELENEVSFCLFEDTIDGDTLLIMEANILAAAAPMIILSIVGGSPIPMTHCIADTVHLGNILTKAGIPTITMTNIEVLVREGDEE